LPFFFDSEIGVCRDKQITPESHQRETIKSLLLDGSMSAQFKQSTKNRVPLRTMARYVHAQVVCCLLLLQLAVTAYAFDTGRPASDEPILETGKPVVRELAGGESHFYSVNLAPHQFLHVVADQQGIDVVLALYAPGGRRVVEADSPNGTQGPEPCWWVSVDGGTYRLEVRALEPDAPPGLYQVKIEERRAATSEDRQRIAAQEAFAKGQQLLAAGTMESRRSSIGDFESAISGWRATGEKGMEATALTRLANVYQTLGEQQKALDYYNQALVIRRALGSKREEANTLNNIGIIYKTLGEPQKAFLNYQRALLLRRAVRDSEGEAVTLHNIAAVYMLLGEPQKALDTYSQALRLRRAVADRSGEAMTLDSLGTLYEGLGNPEKALSYYDQALILARGVGNRREEAKILNNIGLIYASSGDGRRALDYYDQARSLRRSDSGDRLAEVEVLKNLGSLSKSSGESRQALEYYERALSLVRATGDRQGEAIVLNDIGDVFMMRGARQQAFEYYRQALPLVRVVQDRGGEAYTLLNLARAESVLGHLSESLRYAEDALSIVESLRAKIVSQELRATYFASVQPFFEFYINLLMRLHERSPKEGFDVAAFQASERARARSLVESLAESRVNIRQGVDPALLIQEQSLRRALNAKAEQQTRLLNGKHTEDAAAAIKREIDDLLTQFQEVEAQIRIKSPHYAALTQPVPSSLSQIQRELEPHMMLLEYALGEEHSYVWAVTPDSIRSFQLPRRAEIEAAARRVYGLLTARNQIVKFETDGERRARVSAADVEYVEAARVLARMVLGPVAPFLEEKQLLIVSDGALHYVPFAALPVPGLSSSEQSFETLKGSRSKTSAGLSASAENYVPLVVEHEIVNLPSASTLATLRSEPHRSAATAKKVAVIADPVFEKDDERVGEGRAGKGNGARQAAPVRSRTFNDGLIQSARESGFGDGGLTISRLPYTRREADAILALAAESDRKKALDFDASLLTAMSPELGSYRFVHFATHGLLNSAHPELSGIVLSLVDQRGVEQDGFLRVNEVLNLKLPVEMVVLSGCRTGLGKEIKGEGLVGLTRGFMYAGAARVIVSLWGISDEASAELMIRLYQKMLGKEELRPAAALRAAQVSIWKEKRWRAPYYWSAFVLQGEPR
jgi:CHAT domain-containing protein/tetratricopeptide (TPR) repeat protein